MLILLNKAGFERSLMKRKLSVFDLDHTLITANCSYRFCCFLFRRKLITPLSFFKASYYYARHLFFGLPLLELHRQVFNQLLKGLSPDAMKVHVDHFVEEFLGSALYMPAVVRLRLAEQLGEHTAIFSNSPDFLVGPIAKFLGVESWRATTYMHDEEGHFSGLACVVDGEQKAAFLKQMIENLKLEKSQVTAYSDSYQDMPFLSQSGHPIAVNPDAPLKAYAQSHNWPII